MQIIRIEAADGWGIFRGSRNGISRRCVSDFGSQIGDRHQDFNTPFGDGLSLEKDDKNWFCAYKTIEQLKDWIYAHELKHIIEKENFRIYVIDVDEFQEGKQQVVYTKESITSKKDISDLFV